MKTVILLIVLLSIGCASSPTNYYYVTEIKNAGSGIMLTKCRLASFDCQQEFVEVTGGKGAGSSVPLINNFK